MSYLTLKIDNTFEYRVYTIPEYDGTLIYSGHKLSVPEDLLQEIIMFKLDRFGNIFYLDYDKWVSKYESRNPNTILDNIWIKSDLKKIKSDVLSMWLLVLKTLKTITSNEVKTVYITQFR